VVAESFEPVSFSDRHRVLGLQRQAEELRDAVLDLLHRRFLDPMVHELS